MAATTPNMSLKVWNLLTDPYDHEQLAENFAKLDQHRHAEGEGRQIPTGGIEDGAISSTKLAAESVTPAKLSLPAVEKDSTEALSLTTSLQDIVGCTYTTTSAGTFLVIGSFDAISAGTSGTVEGALLVNGSLQPGQANYAATASGQRATVASSWIVKAGSGQIIKLQGKKTAGTYTLETPHTTMTAVQIG